MSAILPKACTSSPVKLWEGSGNEGSPSSKAGLPHVCIGNQITTQGSKCSCVWRFDLYRSKGRKCISSGLLGNIAISQIQQLDKKQALVGGYGRWRHPSLDHLPEGSTFQ